MGWTLAGLLVLALAGCAPSRVGGAPSAAAQRPAPTAATGPSSTPGDSTTAPTSPAQKQADEEIIRGYERLATKGASRAELERFVAEHPSLLRATAKPYGSALLWVLEFEHQEAALVLLQAGAPISRSTPTESGPLHLAARGGLDRVVTELLRRGASAKAEDYWGTPLHFAAKYGHVSTMRLLLQAGADPSAHAQDHQFTPLHAAVIDRHVEAVQVLIAAKADLEATDDDGQTPLHWGGFAYRAQPVHLYAELGKPHDTVFRDPGSARAMELLLDAGARIDARDDEGNTPLHEAVAVGSRRGVELLLARGAQRGVRNGDGKTPLDLARARGDGDIVTMLQARPWARSP